MPYRNTSITQLVNNNYDELTAFQGYDPMETYRPLSVNAMKLINKWALKKAWEQTVPEKL